jgi:hypothetical protein
MTNAPGPPFLKFSKKSKFDRAAEKYRRALEIDPTLAPPES